MEKESKFYYGIKNYFKEVFYMYIKMNKDWFIISYILSHINIVRN